VRGYGRLLFASLRRFVMAVDENGSPQWTIPEDVTDWFAVDPDSTDRLRGALAAATLTLDADSELARKLLLDPLPYLVESLGGAGVTEEWTISLERVNAHRALSGPKKLVCFFLLLLRAQHVHGVIYRLRDTHQQTVG
jgi:hypothetical protein